MRWPRVLSYPPANPHLDRLDGPVIRLVQPDTAGQHPDALHDSGWIAAHSSEWDTVHLHLAPDLPKTDVMVDTVQAHRRTGVPVICTVTTLQPDHLPPDGTAARDLLCAIAPWLSAIVTHSHGFADELRVLTGRGVTVIPYGPVVSQRQRRRLRTERRLRQADGGPVLIPAAPLQPNLGLEEVVVAARDVVGRGRLRILALAADERGVRQVTAGTHGIEVSVGDWTRSTALAQAIGAAESLLLPYRWATHSPLVEIAADVGTPTWVTDAGHLGEQWAIATGGGDSRAAGDLTIAVVDGRVDVQGIRRCLAARPTRDPVISDAMRERSDHAFACLHQRLYQRVLTTTCGPRSHPAAMPVRTQPPHRLLSVR